MRINHPVVSSFLVEENRTIGGNIQRIQRQERHSLLEIHAMLLAISINSTNTHSENIRFWIHLPDIDRILWAWGNRRALAILIASPDAALQVQWSSTGSTSQSNLSRSNVPPLWLPSHMPTNVVVMGCTLIQSSLSPISSSHVYCKN